MQVGTVDAVLMRVVLVVPSWLYPLNRGGLPLRRRERILVGARPVD